MRLVSALPVSVRRIARRIRLYVRAIRWFGVAGALAFAVKEPWYRMLAAAAHTDPRRHVYRLGAGDLTLYARAGSTDRQVFEQVFLDRQYDCFLGGDRPEVIVDCGANVGYTTSFFLSRFTQARVIAVEPDPGNVELLRLNTRAFGDRVEIIPAALWSHCAGVMMLRDSVGGEWEYSVADCTAGTAPDVASIDIPTLLGLAPTRFIDVLKMDIEGAESTVIDSASSTLVDAIRMLIVELHDDRARDAFAAAFRGQPFTIRQSGELTIARRKAPAGHVP